MPRELAVTETQSRFERSATRRGVLFALFYLTLFAGIATIGMVLYTAYLFNQTYGITYLDDDEKHFKYGSIGAELANGLPYRLFLALPKIFPREFGEQKNYSHFGFIYEKDADGNNLKLPIGFAKGYRNSVEVAWFNCAVCHTGQVRLPGTRETKVVLGMPANTVDLERFFLSLFRMVEDKDFSWENPRFKKYINESGDRELTWLEENVLWPWLVLPNTRNVLLDRRNRLLPLLDPAKTDAHIVNYPNDNMCVTAEIERAERYSNDCRKFVNEITLTKPEKYLPYIPDQATQWGPGRVDTFNPYKLINFNLEAHCLKKEERIGISDFPTIFMQKPRGDKQMHLHWDGNNASLNERNLSAAIGAGVTEESVNHRSVETIAEWLGRLPPPTSPYLASLDKAQLERGRAIYMRQCASCHGYQSDQGYVFEGARLGAIEPLAYIGTDPHRLNSYTPELEEYQKERLFCSSRKYRFANFKKTNGYSNQPLDGLWLRAPYLHNGSVPTLEDLLKPSSERPVTFSRGAALLDPFKGGFSTRACSAADNDQYSIDGKNFCFDTRADGNSNAGHEYGTYLSEDAKRDLLTYLLSF